LHSGTDASAVQSLSRTWRKAVKALEHEFFDVYFKIW
jgi:hypothetical protein